MKYFVNSAVTCRHTMRVLDFSQLHAKGLHVVHLSAILLFVNRFIFMIEMHCCIHTRYSDICYKCYDLKI